MLLNASKLAFSAPVFGVLLVLGVFHGCADGAGDDKVPGDTDTDVDTDADTDTDVDTDADSDTDTDTDTDPTGTLECQTPYSTPAPGGDGNEFCVTETLSCGDVVLGTNTGGSDYFGTDDGEQFSQCSGTASGSDFAGPERVYVIHVDESMNSVSARLESCEDSWLMHFRGLPSCTDGVYDSCGYAVIGTFRDQTAEMPVFDNGTITLVIEGNRNSGGNYRLSITCD